MRYIVEDLAIRHMGTPLNISTWRYISISIGRRYLGSLFGEGGDEVSYEDDSDDEVNVLDNTFDL